MLVTPPNFSKSTPLPASRPGEAWSDLSRRGVGPGPGWSPVGNRGAPPRGVDVKPPRAEGSPRALGAPGRPPGPRPGRSARPRSPGSRILGSWDPAPGAPEGPGRPRTRSPGFRDHARGGFYINPSRRGPAVPGAVPGTWGPQGVQKGPLGGPGRQTPVPGPGNPSPGTAGPRREGLM